MSSSSTSAISTGVSGVGSSSLLQVTGLASSLDTTSIINALMALDKQPLTALQNQQSALKARNTQLTSLQSALQQVALNAQALGSPGLFANSQTVTSSDTSRVTATTTSGAGVGGYEVAVTQLANSGQRSTPSPARPRIRPSRSTASRRSRSRPARQPRISPTRSTLIPTRRSTQRQSTRARSCSPIARRVRR